MKKKKEEGTSKGAEEMEKRMLIQNLTYAARERRGGSGTVPPSVLEVVPEVLQQDSKGKGKAIAKALTVQPTKTSRKRSREQVADDVDEADKARREAELKEQARATAASMVTLCGNDPDEAGKQMNKALHQDVHVWPQAFVKAQKVTNKQLKQARDNLELARGTTMSLETEINVLKREKLNIRVESARELKVERADYQAQYDEECETTTRLKNLIDSLGINPETFEPFPSTEERTVEDVTQLVGVEVDLAAKVAGRRVVDSVAEVHGVGGGSGKSGTVIDGTADASGVNPTIKGTGGVVVGEYGDNMANPL
ncbi:hypothetical protein GIB67_004021 [Kingdonia uniflora]|uniref:Uncharacterized protein n=1 Tax=Kingdonia uniflora TaxID=39325 RepID=A0A7J7NR36_9MAGN|nr:hypothetical protein GIB67_004021 [Kingdonia uniflora]